MLRDDLIKILNEYEAAAKESFAQHPLAEFIRVQVPSQLRHQLQLDDRYVVRGSAGKGQWAFAPWLAVLDLLVTETTQEGYYPVFLFREDSTGVYLSLNQGVTDIRRRFGSDAQNALRSQAKVYRDQLGTTYPNFPVIDIDLRPNPKSRLSPDYESGNVYAKFYPKDAIPADDVLIADVLEMIQIYDLLRSRETEPVGTGAAEDDERDNPNLETREDYSRFRLHKRIERNSKLSKKVKELQGFVCIACGFDFRVAYPGIEHREYIEAHHLKPIGELKGKIVNLHPVKDFAVLCANCHRMIHRSDDPSDVMKFKTALKMS